MVGGLLLCTDYALIRLAIATLRGTREVMLGSKRMVAARRNQADGSADDESESAESTGEKLSVRVRRKVRDEAPPVEEPVVDAVEEAEPEPGVTRC